MQWGPFSKTVESLLLSRQRQTFSPTFTHTHSSGPTLNHLQMYELLTLLISQAWSEPWKLQRPEQAHAKIVSTEFCRDKTEKSSKRANRSVFLCQNKHLAAENWRTICSKESKKVQRCRWYLRCRCLGNMFGLERELKVCETRLVFILLCVSTEWLAEPGWKLVGLFFWLLPKAHDRIGEGWTVDQVVQLYQSWMSHYLDHS